MRTTYIFAAAALLALLAGASAASPSNTLNSYLSPYMSNATIAQYSFYNVSLNNQGYVVAAAANGSTYLVISQNSSQFGLLMAQDAINPVLTAYFAQYENLSTVSYLNTAMQKYNSGVASNISDCITETGINPPLTNNFTEAILGCSAIPICDRALYSTFGALSPFGFGIQNFSIQYGIYNTSLKSYFGLIQKINSSNAGDSIAALGTDVSNLSSVASKLSTNPLFPPPASADFSKCNSGLSSQQPWYCVAIGYCGYMKFNTTLLNSVNAVQQQLTALVPSKSRISAYSAASATAATYYIAQANFETNEASFSAFLNSTYPTYNATVGEVSALLSKSPDANLSAALLRLQTSFSAILSNGVNTSISAESPGFNLTLSSLISKYNAANLSFAEAGSASSNYTIAAIAAELNYRNVPPRLAELSEQLQSLDLAISAGMNSTSILAELPELKTIGMQLAVFVPITTMGSLVKMLDGWFINAVLAGSNMPVQSKIAAAPTYAALLSFIIGIVILAIIYLVTLRRLSKKHKLKMSKKATMAWAALFIGIFIVVLVYTYATYAYAQAANSFLPFAYFTNYLHSAKSAYVVLNGSSAYSNTGITACASSISSILTSQGKAVKTIQATNYSCVAGGTVSPMGVGCIDSALASGVPVISLSASAGPISYKGLYGTIMYASGVNATGSSCIVAQLLSRK